MHRGPHARPRCPQVRRRLRATSREARARGSRPLSAPPPPRAMPRAPPRSARPECAPPPRLPLGDCRRERPAPARRAPPSPAQDRVRAACAGSVPRRSACRGPRAPPRPWRGPGRARRGAARPPRPRHAPLPERLVPPPRQRHRPRPLGQVPRALRPDGALYLRRRRQAPPRARCRRRSGRVCPQSVRDRERAAAPPRPADRARCAAVAGRRPVRFRVGAARAAPRQCPPAGARHPQHAPSPVPPGGRHPPPGASPLRHGRAPPSSGRGAAPPRSRGFSPRDAGSAWHGAPGARDRAAAPPGCRSRPEGAPDLSPPP